MDNDLKNLRQEILQLEAGLCYALADTTRILILYLLAEGEATVTQLVTQLEQPQPTVSRHLKVLRERGLVIARREGVNVYYRLSDLRYLQALDILRDILHDRIRRRAKLLENILPEEKAL